MTDIQAHYPYSELVPPVKLVNSGTGTFDFAAGGVWSSEGSSVCTERLSELFSLHDGVWVYSSGPGKIRFVICNTCSADSYELLVDENIVTVRGADQAALFYGALTLFQLIDLCENQIPCCSICDEAAFPVRGVMLDISRDKVPSMQTLFGLVDKFAQLKLNHLQLYMEHTFAYHNHETVWRNASPLTADELCRLDLYCRDRFIELVPNQNSFGHMERWLVHQEYNHLSALPEGGAPLPWGGTKPFPTALNPLDPECLTFLDGLYSELLPCFSSEMFNVGCDEVFELSVGRCSEEVKRNGEGRVYLDFLKKVFALVRKYGRRPAFWGDIIIKYPELVAELPADAIALEWGYEADHPFEKHARLFKEAGLDFIVCPGTSSWNSICGRYENMISNIHSAAAEGLKSGACGLLITDWGDAGHWQPLCVSYPAYIYGAAESWAPGRMEKSQIVSAMSRLFLYAPPVTGEALVELGSLYTAAGALCSNSSVLFHLLFKKDYSVPEGVTLESLESVDNRVKSIAGKMQGLTDGDGDELNIVKKEIEQVLRLVSAACFRGRAVLKGESDENPAFMKKWRVISAECIEAQKHVWMLRNRQGGLSDSIRRAASFIQE